MGQREREAVTVSPVSLDNQDQRVHRGSVACLEHQEGLDRRQVTHTLIRNITFILLQGSLGSEGANGPPGDPVRLVYTSA